MRQNSKQFEAIRTIVEQELRAAAPNQRVLSEWFALPISQRYPELLSLALEGPGPVRALALETVWSSRAWAKQLVELLPAVLTSIRESLPKAGSHGGSYLTKSGNRLLEWLERAVVLKPGNETLLLFLGELQLTVDARGITLKDYRRLLARVIGLSQVDDAFLARLHELFAKSPQMKRSFVEYRGVFVDSSQPDAKEVKRAFKAIEKSLTCAQLLEAVEEKSDEESKEQTEG